MSENEVAVVEDTTAISNIHQLELVDVEYAAKAQQNFLDLVEVLLEDNDYQGTKKKKSAWRKLARAFNISDEPITKEIIRDENHQIISAYFEVKAVLPNGRSGFGVGDCSIFDKIKSDDKEQPSNFELRKRFTNAEHDVIATAHTRAKSRAISDLIGAGEVSAEELDGDVKVTRRSKKDDDSTSSTNNVTKETSNTTSRKRRRRPSKKTEPEVQEAEVIEAKAEVVQDTTTSSSSSKDYHSIEHETIQKAIERIEKRGGEEVTKSTINDEVFEMYTLGYVDLDGYDEAKKILEKL